MNAAVVRSTYKKADLEEVIKQYKQTVLPAVATTPGARSGMLLVDRQTGDAISIAIYEDAKAAEGFAPKAQTLVESFEKFRSSGAPKREIFEIATSTQAEAKSVVERGDKAFNAHDLEGLARQMASDAEITAPGEVKVKGAQAAKEYYGAWVSAFPDARAEVKNMIVQGNTVVLEGVFTGTHDGTLKTPMGDVPATGRKVRGDYVQIFEVDRGLIKKNRLIFDQVQLMTQLGLAPAPPQQQQTAKPAGR
ncbi:MAG TPA: ester cyclase [Candidatus Dormibacteraeota bacterium]|nr:ester cyclase [Candidatus Dormibacteraeota bacterium]